MRRGNKVGFLSVILLLWGCGGDIPSPGGGAGSAAPQAAPPGLYVDATLYDYLSEGFDEVQACTGLEAGTFDALTIAMTQPIFPCHWYDTGCDGEFVEPNLMKLGHPYAWKHEVLHYLLYVNTGDSDPNHTNELFYGTCPL
ncbi:MAG: hypothetical protein ACE5FN_07085 [Leptospirillia bacterium]